MKQTETKTARTSQAGVTILEFIAFIGLAAVVIAGALGLYKTANTGSQATQVAATANALVSSARAAGVAGDYDWATLCMVDASVNTACAVGSTVQITAVPGWSGKAGVFKKGQTAITLTGAANNTKTVSITMPDAESAVGVSKITVGSVAGVVSSTSNINAQYSLLGG